MKRSAKRTAKLVDYKNPIAVTFFYLLNKIVCAIHYKRFSIKGAENVPKSGPYLLIANHTSRWDGLVLMETIGGRPANWMVSPNELKGWQGNVLRSVGSFPAYKSIELINFVGRQIKKGQPIVIFPEGNIFRDGTTHPFKTGAARILLVAHEMGINMPVIPVVIQNSGGTEVSVEVSPPLWLDENFLVHTEDHHQKLEQISSDLHTKVSSDRRRLESMAQLQLVPTGQKGASARPDASAREENTSRLVG
jgi:1-acyl-sn-glycerol-3-phosphate acyltransferase